MKPDMHMAGRAVAILADIADGRLVLTHALSCKTTQPQDDADRWPITVMTDKHQRLTFAVEGTNLASITELVDTDGRRLIGPHNPMAVLGWLPADTANDLETRVLNAHCQVYAK